ncbi:MarR family transcriptional regulator [Kibdelosporangium persicum]|uniref:MarR family transcriptional regulator n=1 Tax=Kibdelosporangium persicum TaxID=2698649 RepID=A0ABX2F2V9_9PSEU|nr:MarR family transcriptional regulator [Kibdelosporangium persicum]NRN65459.1 MarR family transcriptional regulator [Kibdelosporangium persicum]
MTAPEPIAEDLVLLFTALAANTQAQVTAEIAKAGFGDLRPSDGYLVQHLQQGPQTIGELATKLGITAQGVSKTVIEMERKGYVSRTPSSGDQRKRVVELTERGWEAIHASRKARAHVNRELRAILGSGARAFLDQVHHLAETTGALTELTERRLRP